MPEPISRPVPTEEHRNAARLLYEDERGRPRRRTDAIEGIAQALAGLEGIAADANYLRYDAETRESNLKVQLEHERAYSAHAVADLDRAEKALAASRSGRLATLVELVVDFSLQVDPAGGWGPVRAALRAWRAADRPAVSRAAVLDEVLVALDDVKQGRIDAAEEAEKAQNRAQETAHDCETSGVRACIRRVKAMRGATPDHEPARLDAAARKFVAHILPADWGEVEGVVAHRSHRGYVEVHVWTTCLRGRPMEISIGDRFTTSLPIPWAEFEERCRTHGFQGYCVHLDRDESKMTRLEVLEAALAAVVGKP
jgi:hypothetical protein